MIKGILAVAIILALALFGSDDASRDEMIVRFTIIAVFVLLILFVDAWKILDEVDMAVKPNGGVCAIREQIIEDLVSGLTIQFVSMPESDAPVRMRIFGDLPYGNREILFDKNGDEAGAGTAFGSSCRPSWLREVAD